MVLPSKTFNDVMVNEVPATLEETQISPAFKVPLCAVRMMMLFAVIRGVLTVAAPLERSAVPALPVGNNIRPGRVADNRFEIRHESPAPWFPPSAFPVMDVFLFITEFVSLTKSGLDVSNHFLHVDVD